MTDQDVLHTDQSRGFDDGDTSYGTYTGPSLFDRGLLSAEIETIQPDQAAEYLTRNLNPRKLRPHLVARYADDMAAGNFPPGTGCIVFDEDDNLRDGQHRLQACVDANEAFTTIVIRGASEEAVNYIDRGVKRSLADVLRGHGEVNVSHLQASISCGWRWDHGKILSSQGPTIAQALGWLEDNPGIRTAVNRGQACTAAPLRMRISVVAPFAYRATLIDDEGTEDFLRLLVSGAGLEFQSPILRFREAVMNRRSGVQIRREAELALLVKAWNAWINDLPVRSLKWIRQGDRGEDFPLMLDCLGEIYPFPEVS